MSEAVWRSTFQDITVIDLDASVLVLSVPNAVVKDRVENRYLSLVEDIARDVAGESLRIELIVQPDAAEPTLFDDPLDALLATDAASGQSSGAASGTTSDTPPSTDQEPS